MKVKELIAELQKASKGKNYDIIVQDDIAGGDYYLGSKILDVDFNITDEDKVVMILKINTHDGEEEYFEFENLEEYQEYKEEYDLDENMNAEQEDIGDDEDYSEEEDDFVFISEMRHKDYVIEFFKNKQDGKYYWQADYDGEDRKLGNFNIWITVRGIELSIQDKEGYPTKADAIAKAKEEINKQKRRWNESIKTGKSNLQEDSVAEDADPLAKWKAIGGQIESLFKRYVDKKVGNTVIDRVYRDISLPYADELTFGVSSNINFAQKDITSLINSHKQDIERIYSKKLVAVKMLRSSTAAKNQVASITFSLKFDGDIWKDSITEDGWSSYTFKTGLRSDAFKQYLRDRGIYFEPSQDGEYTHFEVKNADEAVDRRANEIVRQLKDSLTEDATLTHIENYKGVKIYQNNDNKKYRGTLYTNRFMPIVSFEEKDLKTLKAKIDEARNKYIKKYGNLDSLTEDDEMLGWIAIYNGTRIEIKKSEASSLYAAKKLAILKFKEKFKNVKEHMISIAPGYEDSLTEDADLTGKIVKYNGMTAKVLRKLTEQEKQERAHLNNPDAGDYYEIESTSKQLGPSKFIVWEARLSDSITEDIEDDEDDYSNDYNFYIEYYVGTSPIPRFKKYFNTLKEAKQFAVDTLINNKNLEIEELYVCTEGINGPVQHDAWFKSSQKWYSEHYNESNDDNNLIVKY